MIVNLAIRRLAYCLAEGRKSISHGTNLFTAKMFSFENRQSFSRFTSKQNEEIDELKNYETYLIKHNQSLRKPHEKLRTEEERIIKKCLQNQRYTQLITFLVNNAQNRLCNIATAVTIDKHFCMNYGKLSLSNKVQAAHALISFRESRCFNLFKGEMEKQISKKKMQEIQIDQLIVYLYGQIIIHKNIMFLQKIATHQGDKSKIVQMVYQCLFFREYKGLFSFQRSTLIRYFSLLLKPSLNRIDHNQLQQIQRTKSLLEIDVEAFLRVLQYDPKRQMDVNSYAVDFVVETVVNGQIKKTAVEVNGNYHYTLNGKLKGREILRNMIVNQCLPLRIIHQNDFLLSRGYRNKLAYIESVLKEKQINWQSKNKGMNSQWQVIGTENL